MPQTYEPSGDHQIDDQLVTKIEIAKLCRTSPRTIEKWVRERRIPSIRYGHRTLRFDPVAVMAAVKRWTVKEIK
jgi:excisionase family DNA binding protein